MQANTNTVKNPIKIGEKAFSQRMVDDTKKYQEKYGFDAKEGSKEFSTHNNQADAFKHTYMQAWLTVKTKNQAVAKYFGDKHENDGASRNQPSGEENMDLWNNEQGCEIGIEVNNLIKKYKIDRYSEEANNLIARKVMERMRAGKLITTPNDKRRYVPKNKGTVTGQAAPVSTTYNSTVSNPVPNKSPEPKKSPSQKFSDTIRQKLKNKIKANNKKINFNFNKSTTPKNSANGHWVTMNGTHVFIED